VDVPDGLRARRVLEGMRYGDRAFQSEAEALAFLDRRSNEELERYANHPDPLYAGVDVADGSAYASTIRNDGPLPETVAEVLSAIQARLG
jgi:hypothetical protein